MVWGGGIVGWVWGMRRLSAGGGREACGIRGGEGGGWKLDFRVRYGEVVAVVNLLASVLRRPSVQVLYVVRAPLSCSDDGHDSSPHLRPIDRV